jgi:leukotriene-A4 hydrolase
MNSLSLRGSALNAYSTRRSLSSLQSLNQTLVSGLSIHFTRKPFITNQNKFTTHKQTLQRALSTKSTSAPLTTPTITMTDASTFSNPDAARITHSDFEIDVNFDTHIMTWWCNHTIKIEKEGAAELILDTRDLDITAVSVDGSPNSNFKAGKSTKALGTAVNIPLPKDLPVGTIIHVEINWTTSPNAIAAQWLAPEQTAGGTQPFLFTQCQAIHARTLVPTQDTPGAKFTYTAAVRVPAHLRALMSALNVDDEGEGKEQEKRGESGNVDPISTLQHIPNSTSTNNNSDTSKETKIYRFKQPLPISSYLLAIAVGDLVSKDLSPISRVWSEPATVDAAAYEFAETPKFLQAAESLAGPYRWGRYDLLLLPPSFPYGGMENVNLTFVTPTLLAGDRSLANVVAHEAAHSWTGNLVTNKSWQAFWLNEGWTVWFERRIKAEIEGEAEFEFEGSMGWISLTKSVQQWGENHKYTCLVPDLSDGCDPDDAFSRIPYEKGAAFLTYLERLVGGKDIYVPFFKKYIEKFANHPVTSDDFKSFFLEYFTAEGLSSKLEEIDWDTWLYKPGMPPVKIEYDESLAKKAYDLALKWHTSDILGVGSDGPGVSEASNKTSTASPKDMDGWTSSQIVAFLDRLNELRSMTPMNPRTTRAMAKAYPILDTTHNAEIRCSWYLLCLKAGDDAIVPKVEEILHEQGRMKFVRPLYRAMFESPKLKGGKEKALETFEKCKHLYHPICAKMTAVDLKLASPSKE